MNYNKELLNRFLTEKVAIALRTQEEWNMFMELLEEETDLTWGPEVKPTEFDDWEKHKKETSIIEGYFSDKTISFCSCAYHEELGCEVIEFKELVKKKEMNLADKLRFLADRWEDGKEFYIGNVRYSLNSGKLVVIPSGIDGEIEINDLKGLNLRLAPQWTFTEDEKVILRNLPEEYKWIARNARGDLFVYRLEPQKGKALYIGRGFHNSFKTFEHLFQSVQWSDEEPCEFRRYL